MLAQLVESCSAVAENEGIMRVEPQRLGEAAHSIGILTPAEGFVTIRFVVISSLRHRARLRVGGDAVGDAALFQVFRLVFPPLGAAMSYFSLSATFHSTVHVTSINVY